MPTYPDGRPAVGWTCPRQRYPLNARVYDACGAKDINGDRHPAFEPTNGVSRTEAASGTTKNLTEGLYPAVLGRDDVPAAQGAKPGDAVYCGVISVHKDLSAPYW